MIQVRIPVPSRSQLEEDYLRYADLMEKAVYEVHKRIKSQLQRAGLHPTIKYRVKTFDSYYQKLLRRVSSQPKSEDWFAITDILGIRVVCPFMSDLPVVEAVLAQEFQVTEREKKGAEFSFKEFGYDSVHYLLGVPQDIQDFYRLPEHMVCEVQLRTILQDAWAEVEHELVYKADYTPFDESLRRKLAALNANLSLADMIFHEIREYQRELHKQLKKRRTDFWDLVRKSEESTNAEFLKPTLGDDLLMNGLSDLVQENLGDAQGPEPPNLPHYDVIDGQLLKAIYAHNAHRYEEAISQYTEIVALHPRSGILGIVLVHRGMAHFALGEYEHAIRDFTSSIETEGDHRKALYYRAVASRQIKDFQAALEDLNACLQLDPYQAEVLLSRAQTQAHLGDYAAALGDTDQAIAIDADNEEARQFRALIATKLGM